MADERDILIRNEQAKLTASYLNGLAIALAAVGGIAPWVAGGEGGSLSPVRALLSTGCVVFSVGLHFGARRILRSLVT